MRKIEEQMNTAIRYRRNWAGSNTMVRVSREVVKVFLHGNHIATYFHAERKLQLFDGGWQSNTTKSRLNALCYELATGFGVFQKNWNWFVGDFQNKTIKDFTDGITVNNMGCF